jgi:hypothetical protein
MPNSNLIIFAECGRSFELIMTEDVRVLKKLSIQKACLLFEIGDSIALCDDLTNTADTDWSEKAEIVYSRIL